MMLMMRWIHVPIDGFPPTVEWNTTTSAAYLQLHLGLPAFIMHHYQRTTSMVIQTEYTGTDGVTIRCHPGYRTGSPWYDWVEVEGHPVHVGPIPFKVVAVVPVRDFGTQETRFELVGYAGTTRTHRDSVLFTEWEHSIDFSVIPAESIVRRSFAVKVSPKVAAIIRPLDDWAYHFTH